ncbi:MAG TPA: TIGR02757 family protein [Cytophagales bacterium]|nr:TIGR02757 family protein [Cytophagales bacterium]HAP63055.1 TIGR02757 family protein [Cytophagales bacterium]
MPSGELKAFFDEKVLAYNQPGFIPSDPISIPHRFSRIQDIEISGFIAATLAWGQRVTIINKCNELLERMDRAPYDFVLNHTEADLKRLVDFKHRTFNTTDTLYFMEFFRWFYQQYDSLEDGFLVGTSREAPEMEKGIAGFNRMFFSLPEAPDRTKKHVATPERKSACKRINMFLRWMVRQDTTGVDFGLWKVIQPRHLVCPCDIHVGRVARRFGLITRQQNDWRTAMELTENLRLLDSDDPVKYDFALFGLGVFEKLQ